jgi:hypothetical protein
MEKNTLKNVNNCWKIKTTLTHLMVNIIINILVVAGFKNVLAYFNATLLCRVNGREHFEKW